MWYWYSVWRCYIFGSTKTLSSISWTAYMMGYFHRTLREIAFSKWKDFQMITTYYTVHLKHCNDYYANDQAQQTKLLLLWVWRRKKQTCFGWLVIQVIIRRFWFRLRREKLTFLWSFFLGSRSGGPCNRCRAPLGFCNTLKSTCTS